MGFVSFTNFGWLVFIDFHEGGAPRKSVLWRVCTFSMEIVHHSKNTRTSPPLFLLCHIFGWFNFNDANTIWLIWWPLVKPKHNCSSRRMEADVRKTFQRFDTRTSTAWPQFVCFLIQEHPTVWSQSPNDSGIGSSSIWSRKDLCSYPP